MDEIADAISDSGSEDDIELNDATASSQGSRRTRWPNSRYRDYEIELPLSLVIEAVNSIMEPQTVEEVLAAPDTDNQIEALMKGHGDLMSNNTQRQESADK
ncbi:hypothetical protein PI124_g2859 [Phytophthora idaei]|nr:hypothetical protein PI125_g13653 [Phytophthora idaei]KAG3144493.1 hypothetical protein PI126_g14140 [Phytophthora idaei]KAG3252514.1 hypothetical protein PI124_g2859 [Phytophthora idaei]